MDEDWKSKGLDDLSVLDFIINLCPGDTDSVSDSGSNTEDDDSVGCAILQLK